MFCGACGHAITADARFCGQCGNDVTKHSPSPAVTPSAPDDLGALKADEPEGQVVEASISPTAGTIGSSAEDGASTAGAGMAPDTPTRPTASSEVTLPQPSVLPKNPGLAVAGSFFIPGLGTLMNGQAGKAAIIFICYAISWLSVFILIGVILAPAVWIWAMVDAYHGAKKWNLQHGIIS